MKELQLLIVEQEDELPEKYVPFNEQVQTIIHDRTLQVLRQAGFDAVEHTWEIGDELHGDILVRRGGTPVVGIQSALRDGGEDYSFDGPARVSFDSEDPTLWPTQRLWVPGAGSWQGSNTDDGAAGLVTMIGLVTKMAR